VLIDGVDQNLVEDFHQRRRYIKVSNFKTSCGSGPVRTGLGREGPNIGVGAFENMLNVCEPFIAHY
jgi:hypothetical protein